MRIQRRGVTKSEVAQRLHLTKTSITRATAQLQSMGLILQKKNGTEVRIVRNCSRSEYCRKAREYLICPVQKTIEVRKEEDLSDLLIAGESALSMASSLNPPRIMERAVYKGSSIVDQLIPADSRYEDKDTCTKIQLWKYDPVYFAKNGRVDPVSLVASFLNVENERVEMSLEELWEEI